MLRRTGGMTMKTLLAALLVTLASASAALAFDSRTEDLVGRYKAGKLVKIADVQQLMEGSARWCYFRDSDSCAWTDIYLEVGADEAVFEIGNAWDERTDIAYVDQGMFKGDRICQRGFDWIPSVRATRRGDGSVIGGRELHNLKAVIRDGQSVAIADKDDCFDYLFVGADEENATVTVLQRQYIGGEYDPPSDVEVTILFDQDDADALTLRW